MTTAFIRRPKTPSMLVDPAGRQHSYREKLDKQGRYYLMTRFTGKRYLIINVQHENRNGEEVTIFTCRRKS